MMPERDRILLHLLDEIQMKKTAPIYATPAEVQFLGTLLAELRPQVGVEIGSWLGGSTQLFMEFCARLYCIDHWRGDGNVYPGDFPGNHMNPWERFRNFVETVDDKFLVSVIPCVGDSKLWCQVWNQPIDFLYIDGDHSYKGVQADILGWAPFVRSQGLVLGHDYEDGDTCMFPGVKKAVDEIYPDRILIPNTRFWMIRKP